MRYDDIITREFFFLVCLGNAVVGVEKKWGCVILVRFDAGVWLI